MTTAIDHQLTALGEPDTRAAISLSTTRPADMGLLDTLTTRVHCRTPMQRVDPQILPVRQPVYVDGTSVVALGTSEVSEQVETYRCACGFTIDAPVLSGHALAS
ncbi:hypothetical protein Asphe3_04160 [Pseudarthrobacter phenanthrenivorans Sphe3]|uniref:Uncharacterized protein n=1 Tax=Pseudarthrobacter phenanthrenivorans (strain DSM 18606 / JCM 16027 / LMG 23796 / Sphe3) TaxID=930171 RepID=F0M9F4_PSEPM|nr:hypothetical protein [Pseudarthrobacter phenanthrenivorans]ADX71631.1 hypothetical protein Asphe3_04160 [Pseudarthrobacter phenanthrenivorans Sphe3]